MSKITYFTLRFDYFIIKQTAPKFIKFNLLTTGTWRCTSNALGQKKTRQAIVQSCLGAFWIVVALWAWGNKRFAGTPATCNTRRLDADFLGLG